MTEYEQLRALMPAAARNRRWDAVNACLLGLWVDDYRRHSNNAELVETTASSFSYLFDIAAERLVAAWGVSRGRQGGARDSSRIAGAPRTGGTRYHRGHAIPHRLGGGTDINLVAQLGTVNIGAFKRLEKEAIAAPGALYFTHWSYEGTPSVEGKPGQVPMWVDQGLLVFGREPVIRRHGN